MIRLAARRRLRLGTRARAQHAPRVAGDAVGIGEREAQLVVGVGREIEHAAREHIRRDVRERAERECARRARRVRGRDGGIGPRELGRAIRRVIRVDEARSADAAVHLLVLQPQERQRAMPRRLAAAPVLDRDARVAVVVAFDRPIDAERDQRRRLERRLAHRDSVFRVGGRCEERRADRGEREVVIQH